ncbi:MAG TPA: DUF1269 domain-containing protein [Solirubrobacteraceae bacterium]
MPLDTYVLLAGQYEHEADAIADYDAVHEVYAQLDMIDTYDAAVLTKDADGKVSIVKKHEEPTRQGAAGGLVAGLAVGAAIALFPAVALGGALLAGGAAGAGLGAIAGHVSAGLSRSDLKDLGELLDDGTSGLLVIAATDAEAHVEHAITRAEKQEKKQVQVDPDKLRAQIDAA